MVESTPVIVTSNNFKKSLTVSGVAQNSELDNRICMTVALHLLRRNFQVLFPSEMSLKAHIYNTYL